MTLTRLLARPLLAATFVTGGVSAARNADAMAQRAKPVADKLVPVVQRTVPQVTLPTDPKTWVRINAGVHVAAGLALATGRAPRLSALALAASMVPTTVAGHPFWDQDDPIAKRSDRVQFFKNVSLVGGLLLAGVDTGGKPGLAWRARRAVTDARRQARHLRKAARREAKLAAKSVAG